MFVEKETNGNCNALLPTRGEDGGVKWHSVTLSKQIAATRPIKFAGESLKNLITVLLSQNYGWGGYLVNRDCSALVRDYFAAFKIPLPRNSFGQSQEGKIVMLSDMSLEEKKQTIVKYGVPFRTILYRPGHVAIYLGQKNGQILILHNVWGNHTRGGKGRNIIGRAIISTVEYGKEIDEVDSKSLFLNSMSSMSIL